MIETPVIAPVRPSAAIGIALAVSTLLLSLLGSTDAMTGIALAACAGGVAALGKRVLAIATAILLLPSLYLHRFDGLHPAEWIALCVLLAAAIVRRIAVPPLPAWAWALFPPLVVIAASAAHWLTPGGIGWFIVLLSAAALGALCGFAAARTAASRRASAVVAARHALGDSQWLTQTTRFHLLGRLAGGMAHELSQALNVITMANGNLGYILDRVTLPEPQGPQLTERVRKIATHADAAARMLGHFRWFGQDGGREGVEMTVGSALERAISATRAAARKSGVLVEIRGDALGHAVPLRHGTIEMMATAALLEVMDMLGQLPPNSEPPQPIILEATRTENDIEISVLSRSGNDTAPVHDDVADATYDLVSRLAATCRSELKRVGRKGYPVRFVLRMDRDVV